MTQPGLGWAAHQGLSGGQGRAGRGHSTAKSSTGDWLALVISQRMGGSTFRIQKGQELPFPLSKAPYTGMDWGFRVSRCKLLHVEWINNKVLLYSTGNYIQYPVINHNGKKYEKECVCVCVCI